MHAVACPAPIGPLEPAPITSLSLESIVDNSRMAAFWGADDVYYLQTVATAGGETRWYRLDAGVTEREGSLEERVAIGKLMHDITPIGGGRVAFPVGSSGRRVYRVWRSNAAEGGRTRILEVRAARSRRLPA